MKKICLSLVLLLLLLGACKPAGSSVKTMVCTQIETEETIEYAFVGEKPVTQIIVKITAHYSYFGFANLEEFEASKAEFVQDLLDVFYPDGKGDAYSEGENIIGTITIAGADFDFSYIQLDEKDYNKVTFDMIKASAEPYGISCVIE
ncbi:MAG: hypothetical protein LBR25_07855 [Erysipelotrichaceae bacterium]|jgi:hypothetical protein|nr:hypothetical protein [Erysipelotrichaceae bacterium]